MSTKNLVIYHYFEKDASNRDNLLDFLALRVFNKLGYVFAITGKHSLNLYNF